MGKTRIYEVLVGVTMDDGKVFGKTFLVEATSQATARRHVVNKYVSKATLPSGKQIASLMGAGVKVETAGEAA